ncbi:transglutaminase-like domain-containing protein [Diaphorobacter aerolatus]|uniref:Transglutaminase family protein n=1 Tax=Diaphorobacter aerolatus TaxID=1288495 RepID=A0A7H0GKI5_9BURK|nr:transglutaminase family protein [Diaphorobacter aerolatus]QNP48801.1 transglutaminase family protein [Diaphorobacter aerolatus]
MVRLQYQLELSYTVADPGADFFFYIHPAETAQQHVASENLTVSQPDANWEIQLTDGMVQRCLRLAARPGPLTLRYESTIDIAHHLVDPAQIPEVPVARLPLDVLQYIYPSRYCQSDRLSKFAMDQFGYLPQGYTRAKAICEWVQQNVTFRSNTSSGTTAAVDTLLERVGVCRDFAHLMIALCRAINLPARFVSGTDYGADPSLGPPDFHAYVEVYMGDRWYLFDPSNTAIPMGMMRLATGRDAADVAFATIFGPVMSAPPRIHVEAIEDPERGWSLPVHTPFALSTG